MTKTKFLEEEAKRKAEEDANVNIQNVNSNNNNSNDDDDQQQDSETPEQDDDVFYDSDAGGKDEEYVLDDIKSSYYNKSYVTFIYYLFCRNCKACPVVKPIFLCGSDNRTYSSLCRMDYHNCIHGSSIKVSCKGFCPCKGKKHFQGNLEN